jgi:hypothetical protein
MWLFGILHALGLIIPVSCIRIKCSSTDLVKVKMSPNSLSIHLCSAHRMEKTDAMHYNMQYTGNTCGTGGGG